MIAVVADALSSRCAGEKPRNMLYCSEAGLDAPFSAQRALSRNRLIHALGEKVIAVQPGNRTGGTWAGSAENLKKGWSPVFVAADGRLGTQALAELGAVPITRAELQNLENLRSDEIRLF